MLGACERDVEGAAQEFRKVTYQLCALGGVSMIVLCVSMRIRPTAATFLSLCGILGTCGTMKLMRI